MNYRWAAVFTLLCGAVIYPFFRDIDNIVLFNLFPKPSFLSRFPLCNNTGNLALSMLVFCGPDILWLLSGLLFIRSVWLEEKIWMQIYISAFSLIAISNELTQFSPNIPGTFDVSDLLSLCFTAFMESVVYHYFINRRIG